MQTTLGFNIQRAVLGVFPRLRGGLATASHGLSVRTQARVQQSKASAAEAAQQWLSPWRFAALLGLLFAVCFPQVLLGFEAFAYGDSGTFAYPVAFYLRESIWQGILPLWNPLNSCGIPFLAQWNTLTLYPLSLVYVLLPLPWSFALFCMGHLVIGGVGMYLLARSWIGVALPAAFAGTVFAFNGLTWSGLMWPHIIAALAWMPWLVLAVEQAWSEGGRAVPLAAGVAAMQLLTGGAEVILQTWLALGVLGLIRMFTRGGRLAVIPLRLFAIAGLAAALSAVQLFPFLDLVAHSQRSSAYAAGAMGSIAAMPLTGWLNYLVPLFGCLRNSTGVFVQAGQSWTISYYLGGGAILFALLALWRVRERRAWALAGLALFGLLMSLGSRGLVFDAVKRLLPFLGFLRFPVKFVVLPTFALPLLAGLGLNHILTVTGEQWNLEWRTLRRLALALCVVMAFVAGVVWPPSNVGGDPFTTAMSALTRLGFLLAVLFCIWLLRRNVEQRFRALPAALLVALAWFDVFTHSSNLSPTVPSSFLAPNAVRKSFDWHDQLAPGSARAMQSKRALWAFVSGAGTNVESAVSAARLSLFMNANLLDSVAKFDGFYSLDLKHYLDVFKHVYFTTNDASRLQDFLGISHVTSPTNLLDWAERESFMPPISAGQKPLFAHEDETMSALLSGDFEPRQVVYLPAEAEGQVQAGRATNAQVSGSRVAAHRLEAQVETDATTMLVIAQSFYHPWRAFVDGKETRVWRANYAFQDLELPPGRHQVLLVYRDLAFLWGSVVSVVSLLAVAGWLILARRKTANK
jgi:hypothetical protein